MARQALLDIQLAGSAVVPGNACSWNEVRGGAGGLLRWLEVQLGLQAAWQARSTRVTQYAAALESVPEACFARSLARDRWATASELLRRRDDLLLAGWDEEGGEELPALVEDLARTTRTPHFVAAGEAGRLDQVRGALDAGQTLPPHRCVLRDPLERWPARWREVLSRLDVEVDESATPGGLDSGDLLRVQEQVCTGEPSTIPGLCDLRWIRALSEHAACEALASALAREPELLGGAAVSTVVCCENEAAALCLEESFARRGLPTMGARSWSMAHPALQVLPLVLNLCWEPVDPKLLLDLLSLPVSPIPRRAARILSNALGEQPGMGSRAWDEALSRLLDPAADPDGELGRRLEGWLGSRRHARGEALPTTRVRERCKKVARWTAAYAAVLRKEEREEDLAGALSVAAVQAGALGELAAGQGESITEPQLSRLLEAALPHGIESGSHRQAAGGATLVSSLSEITGPVDRLIWLGLGTQDGPACGWSRLELHQLQAAGIDVDDGRRVLQARRAAERRGLCRVRRSVLAVSLPGDGELRPHPVWLQLRQVLEASDRVEPVPLELVLTGEASEDLSPWLFETASEKLEAPQPARPLWSVAPGLLKERRRSSASSLETRLGCPLKWVLHYQARLRPSHIASLPGSFQLRGSFCHAVLEDLFAGGGRLPDVDQATAAAGRIFDERLPLDAAPMAQPGALLERYELRQQLLSAVETLVRALSAGGYEITGMEQEITGALGDRELTGYIDCLAVDPAGREVVVDFKYGGVKKYRKLLMEGRATQLATYAFVRSCQQDSAAGYPAVAYLILADGVMYTTVPDRLTGDGGAIVLKSQGVEAVWRSFTGALSRAEGWLEGRQPVPARPLLDADQWPEGVDLVLDPKTRYEQGVCTYCDYKVLCGLKELF